MTAIPERARRVRLPVGRVALVGASWASKLCRFTLLFEMVVLTLARQVPSAAVAHTVGESRHRVHAICKRYVELALVEIDVSDVTSAAVDETCYKRGHEPFVPNAPPSFTSAPDGVVNALRSECEIACPAWFRICGVTHAAHDAHPFQDYKIAECPTMSCQHVWSLRRGGLKMRRYVYFSLEDGPHAAPGSGASFNVITTLVHRLAIWDGPACAAIMNWFPKNSKTISFKDC